MQNRKSHLHHHIRAVPAIAFIVAIATAAGYAIWSNSNKYDSDVYYPYELAGGQSGLVDTKDWKTYANAEIGFGVKYPAEFTVAFDAGKKTLRLVPSVKSAAFTGIQLAIKDNPQSLVLTDWWKQSSGYNASFIVENIPGKGAGLKTYSADKRVLDNYVLLARDTAVYEFFWSALNERIAEQILATFYFSAPKNPVANWKTYQSQQHGFTVQYPETVTVTTQTDASVRFGAKGIALPVVLIHSMEVSSVSQKWLNDVLINYSLTASKPVLDGMAVTTAAGRGEYKDHTLYIIPKDSGTVALVEISNGDLGKQILSTFKFAK